MRFDASRWMVIDVESTCWERPEDKGAQESDIIEIGIAIVDLRKRELESTHQLYVQPVRSTVSTFCTNLTGITPEILQAQGQFPEVWPRVAELVRDHNTGTWASWGDYDRNMFENTVNWWNEDWLLPRTHMNLKQLEATMRGRDRGVGQKRSVQAAGLTWEGRNHCGRDDAQMAARVLIALWERR